MATIPITTIVQLCGIKTAAARNRIIYDIISQPKGMKYLNGATTEEMLGTFRDYACRDTANGKIIFIRVQQSRLIPIMDWVKDRTRLEEEVSCPDGTTRQEFRKEFEESTTRKKCRKDQKKVGGYLITTSLQVHLEASGQWDCWVLEL